MPGLYGFAGDLDARVGGAALARMAKALSYHEWYSSEHCHEVGFGLGQVSLGLVDKCRQPLWNHDRTVCAVIEGEIFDRGRLPAGARADRRGTNAQLILDLYERHGQDFVASLNGAFSTAVWDKRERTLLLASDFLGLQPLFYRHQNGYLCFAAAVHALSLATDEPLTVDSVAVAELLTFEHVLGNRTLIENIQLLPPASVLRYRDGRITVTEYWKPQHTETGAPLTRQAYREGLLHHLRQAVQRQAPDGQPAGVLLSGGLDSRMIAALLCDGPSEQRIVGLTNGLRGCDDARLASEVASKLKIAHHFFELTADGWVNSIEEGTKITDGLTNCIHMSALPTLREETELARVIYKGYMGDALMGGHMGTDLWMDYDDQATPEYLLGAMASGFTPSEQVDLMTDGFYEAVRGRVSAEFRSVLKGAGPRMVANLQNYFDIRERQRRFILNGVQLVRSQALVRTPFCDRDLVNYMLAVPVGLRTGRQLFIEVLAHYFPELAKVPYEGTGLPLVNCARDLRIRINRQTRWWLRAAGLTLVRPPRKRPYTDYGAWMRTSLREWVTDTLVSSGAIGRGYFKAKVVRRLITEHMDGTDHTAKLGLLLTLETWHKQRR